MTIQPNVTFIVKWRIQNDVILWQIKSRKEKKIEAFMSHHALVNA